MHSWSESNVGIKYFENMAKKHAIKRNRYKRFEKWLETNNFDLLIYRLILEHDEKYCKKCYDKGFEPYPNNKLTFLLGYITDNIEPLQFKIPEIDNSFVNMVCFYKNYYFQITWGQGVLIDIYDKNLKPILRV